MLTSPSKTEIAGLRDRPYVDGAEVAVWDGSIDVPNTGDWLMGYAATYGNLLGSVADFMVYPRELSADEIHSIGSRAVAKRPMDAPLLHVW